MRSQSRTHGQCAHPRPPRTLLPVPKSNPDRASAKHFTRKQADDTVPPAVPFSVDFERDDTVETHHFTARPKLLFGPMVGMVKHGDSGDARALTNLHRMIRQMLVNDDGTPERWKPTITDGHFTAPDGTHTDVEQLPKLLAFDAGSSRRRWTHLMEYDDHVEVDFAVIQDMFEYLVEQVANRPT